MQTWGAQAYSTRAAVMVDTTQLNVQGMRWKRQHLASRSPAATCWNASLDCVLGSQSAHFLGLLSSHLLIQHY